MNFGGEPEEGVFICVYNNLLKMVNVTNRILHSVLQLTLVEPHYKLLVCSR